MHKPRRATPPSDLRAMLFDLDDTLCDYAGARWGRLRTAFSRALEGSAAGPEVDLDALIAESIATHPHGSDHFGPLLERHGVGSRDVVAGVRLWYHTNRFLGLKLYPDAKRTLQRLRQARPEVKIGLITNGPTEVQRAKIDLLDLAPLIDFAVISEEFGVAKPDPAIFEDALRQADATADQAVFIGDSPEFDIAGAQAVGIFNIWMNHSGKRWPDDRPAPDREVRRVGDVLDILDGRG